MKRFISSAFFLLFFLIWYNGFRNIPTLYTNSGTPSTSEFPAGNDQPIISEFLFYPLSYGNENTGRINYVPVILKNFKYPGTGSPCKWVLLMLPEKKARGYFHISENIDRNLEVPEIIFPFNSFW